MRRLLANNVDDIYVFLASYIEIPTRVEVLSLSSRSISAAQLQHYCHHRSKSKLTLSNAKNDGCSTVEFLVARQGMDRQSKRATRPLTRLTSATWTLHADPGGRQAHTRIDGNETFALATERAKYERKTEINSVLMNETEPKMRSKADSLFSIEDTSTLVLVTADSPYHRSQRALSTLSVLLICAFVSPRKERIAIQRSIVLERLERCDAEENYIKECQGPLQR